jgi:prolipoprotein diacylglyceryltransferase
MAININVGKTMYPYPILFGLNLYDIALTLAILIALLLCDKMMEKRKFSVALQKLVLVGFLICILFGFFSAFLFQGFYDFLATKEFKLDSTTGITFFGGLLGGAFAFLTVWFVGGKLFLKDDAKGEEKSKFLDHVNAWSVVNGESNLDSFIVGFRLGAKFTYDTFISDSAPFSDFLWEDN